MSLTNIVKREPSDFWTALELRNWLNQFTAQEAEAIELRSRDSDGARFVLETEKLSDGSHVRNIIIS